MEILIGELLDHAPKTEMYRKTAFAILGVRGNASVRSLVTDLERLIAETTLLRVVAIGLVNETGLEIVITHTLTGSPANAVSPVMPVGRVTAVGLVIDAGLWDAVSHVTDVIALR